MEDGKANSSCLREDSQGHWEIEEVAALSLSLCVCDVAS